MIRRGVALVPLVFLLLSSVAARPAAAATAAAPVSYLSGGSVYVDAGSIEGLKAGDTLCVLRAGREIARVRVTFASSHRAACDTLWTKAPVAVGDQVQYTAAPPPAPDTTAAAVRGAAGAAPMATRPRPQRTGANRSRLRGRIGAGWLSVESSDGGSFKQPSLMFRVDGTNLNGGRTDLAFDMRTRRTTRNFSGSDPTTENLGRVYRASLTMRGADPGKRLVLGRQTSAILTSVSLFDGALLELTDDSHSFGLFGGTQPDADRYSFSSDIVETGAYFEFHQSPRAIERWSVAVGGVTSLDHGHPNRDFGFFQGFWFSKGLTASLTQEIDLNRSWKRANGEPLLTPSSTFASANVPLVSWFALSGGYDNRRNVRLYRDRLTPETEFDDAFRQGAWVGGQLSLFGHARIGGDTRTNNGGGQSESWSLHGEVWRLGLFNLSVRGRYSRFSDSQQLSQLQSFGGGIEPFRVLRLDVTSGIRSTKNPQYFIDDQEHWTSIDSDLTIGRYWYFGAGYERDYGGSSGETKQVQASLNRRF